MYIFTDTETNALPLNWKAPLTDFNNWPRLVSVSWILTELNGTIVSEGDFLVQPSGFIIPPNMVHGISHAEALENGVPLGKALVEFTEAAKQASYLVGHNISFDRSVISCELLRMGMPDVLDKKETLCTMMKSVDFCNIPNGRGGKKWAKLTELHEKVFGVAFENAHNSMADIIATKNCFFELQAKGIIEQHVVKTEVEETADQNKELIVGDETVFYSQNRVTPQMTTSEPVKRKRRTKAEIEADKNKPATTDVEFNGNHVTVTSADPAIWDKKISSDVRIVPPIPGVVHNPVTDLIKSSEVPQEKALAIANSLAEFFQKAAGWNKTIDELIVTSSKDTDTMKVAGVTRLALKNLRLDGEKLIAFNRKTIKEKIAPELAEDKLWLDAGKILEATIKPLESKLAEKEKFIQIQEAKEREELAKQRAAEMSQYTDADLTHMNLGAMAEKDFQVLLFGAKKAQEDAKAQEKKFEDERKAKEKIFSTRLAQLTSTNWNGKEAVYDGKVVASYDSLLSMSDIAFSTIVEAHNKVIAADKDNFLKGKLQRRINRLFDLDKDFVGGDPTAELLFRGDVICHVDNLKEMTDDDFDTWFKQWSDFILDERKTSEAAELAKKDEIEKQLQETKNKLIAIRKNRLIEAGLQFDNITYSYSGKQYVSQFSVTAMADEEFEIALNTYKAAVAEEKHLHEAHEQAKQEQEERQAELEKPDLLKIEKLINDLTDFPLPITSGLQANNMVNGTKKLIGKIVTWLEQEKLKI